MSVSVLLSLAAVLTVVIADVAVGGGIVGVLAISIIASLLHTPKDPPATPQVSSPKPPPAD